MGATIRALRGHAHISQIALGARVALHHNYLGAIERGEIPNPGLDTVDRIARGLGVSIAVLAASYDRAPEDALRVDATGGRPRRASESYDPEALGRAIRVVRRMLDLTQEQLGTAIEMHRNQLGSIEAGDKTSPGIATIARIAHGLGAQLGARDSSLLPLLAQAYTGEKSVADVRAVVVPKPSGSPGARRLPQAGTGP